MFEKIKELMIKYRELIVYVIVGFMVTFFCWGVAGIGKLFLDVEGSSFQNFLNNTLNWIAGVSFAYPLNRKWVFKSTNPQIFKEFLGFASSRLSTWVLDVVIMWLTVNIFHWNYWICKIFISSVLVMIVNYLFSKFLIFRKKKKQD
ncbi:MAG: GtrA family protein [Lachnospiraceae bacterium]|nr:GtrA family protein [Lachnospiraceae bacterium]